MSSLANDLERFAEMWLSNPSARLDLARLVGRVVKAFPPATLAVRAWVESEKTSAKRLGIE